MRLSQLEAYALTIAIEALIAARLAPRFGAARGRAALVAAGGSAITHPIVWWGSYALYPLTGMAAIPLLEAFAILAEGTGYRYFAVKSWRGALLLSGLANAVSWALGAALTAL